MKKGLFLGLAILVLAGSVLAGSKLILDQNDGLAEKAQVLDYTEGTVRLTTSEGVEKKPLDEFSETAQAKIMNWANDKKFLSSDLKVDIEEESSQDNAEHIKSLVWHRITIENRSEVDFKNVKMEGVTFFDTHTERSMMNLDLGRYLLTTQCIDLPAGTVYSFETRKMGLRDVCVEERFDDGRDSYKHYSEDDLDGFYLRLTKSDRNGESVTNDYKDGKIPRKKELNEYHECTPEKGLAPPQGLLGEECVLWYEKNVERGWFFDESRVWYLAYKLCWHYSILHEADQAAEWAERSRELFRAHPAPWTREGCDLSDLNQFVQEASEKDPLLSFFDR